MKKFLFFIMCFVCMTVSAQTQVIENNQVPQSINVFVDKWFPNRTEVTYLVEYDFGLVDEYEVRFSNGTVIEFNKHGHLKSVECAKGDNIDKDMLPSAIKSYLNLYHSNVKVKEYSIDNYSRRYIEYEVELENGISINFNKRFKVIEIDY